MITAEQRALADRMLNLRDVLRMSRLDFARMLGIESRELAAFELGDRPWRAGLLSIVEERVHLHLAGCYTALRDAIHPISSQRSHSL